MNDAPRRRWRLPARLWSDRSLAGRLMVLQVAVLAFAMVAVVAVVATTFDRLSMSAVEAGLADDITEFKTAALARPASQSLDGFTSAYLARQPFELGTFLVVQVAGQPAQGNPGSEPLQADPQVKAWLAHPPDVGTFRSVTAGSRQYRVRQSPITLGPQTLGSAISFTDLRTVANETVNVSLLTAGEAGVAVLLAVVSTYVVLRRVLRVVAEVTSTAGLITSANPSRRLEERPANDEIGRLVHTFNDMLNRLESASQAQRRLLSDVSHQMRTPLTVMRGHLEVARRTGLNDPAEARETIDLVLDELAHTGALVDRMLVLGRSLEPDFVQPEPVDLRSFLSDVSTAARILAPRQWALGAIPDLVILVDRDKIRGALLNLVDNAIKATGPGDTIRIGAEVGPGGAITILVADTGRGIPIEQHERIFQRFERGARVDERGSGLGLAIVKAVAEAHGGHVAIDSAAGAGCTVRIVLPASRIAPGEPVPNTVDT
ncbi:MAG: HAMP domain-containing protein [Chloroflexi bacterium]|nr:HAMP domain-containing protein [Chloroflexota bacterium]